MADQAQLQTETAASLTTLAPLFRALGTDLQTAREAYEDALFSGCDATITIPLGRELARLEDEADPAARVRRLRLNAVAFRYSHQQNMDEYGREIGRATMLANKGETGLAALVKSAANACLDLACDYLTQAIEAEREAEEIESGGFFTLFDGVSVRRAERKEA